MTKSLTVSVAPAAEQKSCLAAADRKKLETMIATEDKLDAKETAAALAKIIDAPAKGKEISHDIMIRGGTISIVDRSATCCTCFADEDTLIRGDTWLEMIEKYGPEAKLLEALGVTEDLREPEYRREPEPEPIEEAKCR